MAGPGDAGGKGEAMQLLLHRPDERPALKAGQPCVWHCAAVAGHPREAARALLSRILCDYLGGAPQIGFEAGLPPHVDAPWQGLSVSASLSYAGARALIGVCPGGRIGVDLVPIQVLPDMYGVARVYLGPAAEAALFNVDESRRAQAFAFAWAALEARGKCLGLGLEEWSPAHGRRLGHPSLRFCSAEWRGHAVGVAVGDAPAGPAPIPWRAR